MTIIKNRQDWIDFCGDEFFNCDWPQFPKLGCPFYVMNTRAGLKYWTEKDLKNLLRYLKTVGKNLISGNA
jgi:hypothetical protein